MIAQTLSSPRRCLSNTIRLTVSSLALALLGCGGILPAHADDHGRRRHEPELPSPACDSLDVPARNEVTSHLYASGVQIYRWNGTSWAFVAPEATLFADPCFEHAVAIHYAGPTWEANDRSKVVGTAQTNCVPFRGAIPWLRLRATSAPGHGEFARLTYIQRVNTVGGTAPAQAGTGVGDEARVPYIAEYYFYRASKK